MMDRFSIGRLRLTLKLDGSPREMENMQSHSRR
jgi:hypothetical protein